MQPASRSRAPLWMWLMLPVVVVVGLSFKVWWDVDHAARISQHKARMQTLEQRHDALYRDLQQAFGQDVGAIESAFQTGPLTLSPDPQDARRRVATWRARDSRANYELGFNPAGELEWVRPIYMTVPPQPGDAAGQVIIDRLGRRLCPTLNGIFTPLAYIVWLPLLVAYLAMPRRRKWLSFAVACCATLLPLIWLMASFSLLELNGVMSYDANFWGMVMFVVSAITLAIGGVHDRTTDLLACRQCGYSLRGNSSGVCPECGAAVTDKQAALLERIE